MNIHNYIKVILFSSFLQFSHILSNNQPCYPSKSISCMCSGFESYCQLDTGYTFLNFPKSGLFIVQNIDYTKRELRLFDPSQCLAEKMMFLNLTSTPFQYKSNYNQFYMLYKCNVKRGDNVIRNNTDVHVINCLSSESYTVVLGPWNYTMPSCDVVDGGRGAVVLPVDYERGVEPFNLVLTWSPDSKCLPQLACPGDFGLSSNKKWIMKATIAIALGLPGMLCLAWFVAKLLAMRWASATATTRVVIVNPNPPSAQMTIQNVNRRGLDQPTLDSYPTMVIGESGRFLNSSNQDKICPICLAEYQSKDIIKILPECLHKFHVECIDEWLRSKAMCPMCRATPSIVHS